MLSLPLHHRSINIRSTEQYRPGHVRRELNKLYTGFYCDDDPDFSPAIATGNWGCGAFGGDPVFKGVYHRILLSNSLKYCAIQEYQQIYYSYIFYY